MPEVCEKVLGVNKEGFTQDGTVDLKGRPILRSKRGRWKACSFIVGYEAFERMAYYGISSNLVLYLTRKLHEGTVESSNNVTNWSGTVWITPLFGAYIADAYLGRYRTFVISSVIYLMGMSLLTLTVSLPALRPPSCGKDIKEVDCNKHATSFQIGIFYCALYIIAIGTGGTKPNISTMGADQFDNFEPKERKQKLSFFNWWMFSIVFGVLFANTFLVYIQDNVGFSPGYAIPTAGLAVSICVFLIGTPFYRHKLPTGSPYTRMTKVLVAALINKRKMGVPDDPKELYELNLDDYTKCGKFKIDYTPTIRILDKAAVNSGSTSPWMLCPVTQVEETKQMIKMLPLLLASLIPSAIHSQGHTLFIKQGATLDRSMGPNFEIPPACLGVFVTFSMFVGLAVYERFFVPAVRHYTKNPRGLTLLQRMGIGLLIHNLTMIVASCIESKRLRVARNNGATEKGDIVPLTIFILLPQYLLLGVSETFLEVAKLEFFYDQSPEEMKSIGTSYYTTTIGIGNFLSSFILTTVSEVTKHNGHKGWILDNLNQSHLDYYYRFYVVLGFLNFLFFLVVSKMYVYKTEIIESEREMILKMKSEGPMSSDDKRNYL